MNPKERLKAARAAAKALADTVRGENRNFTAEEAKAFDGHMADAEAAQAEIDAARETEDRLRKAGELTDPEAPRDNGGDGGSFRKSVTIGEHYVEHCKAQILARTKGERFTAGAPEYGTKAATDTQLTPASGAGLAPLVTDYDRTFVTGVRRRLTVADLLPNGAISGNALTYFIEGAMEGDYTTVAEGAQKPQIHFADPTSVTEPLKKIAAFIKESDEMVEDFPFLVSAINNRLLYRLRLFEEDQLLNGNGTGTNIRGLLNRTGIQTLGLTTDAKAGNLDQIFKAATAVDTGSGFTADGIIINPTDYQTFRLAKDANNQYYGGGPFTGQYGVGGVMEQPPLWGIRTVVTPAIAAGTVLVGAFQAAAEVLRKGGVRVESTNSNEDDFENNRITIRAEERLLLAVRYPAALVKVTLGTT